MPALAAPGPISRMDWPDPINRIFLPPVTAMLRTCNRPLRPLLVLAAALSALLTGCGGSGGSDTGSGTSAAAAAGTTLSATGTSANASSGVSCGLGNLQADLIAEINRRRASAQTCGSRGSFPAVGALRWNERLLAAAAVHAQDMIAHGFFGHTGSSGSSVGDRVTAAGYAWSTVAENIAAGQPTVARVVDAWMSSDSHCANVMNASVNEFAVACSYNPANQSNYWVMDLAKAR